MKRLLMFTNSAAVIVFGGLLTFESLPVGVLVAAVGVGLTLWTCRRAT